MAVDLSTNSHAMKDAYNTIVQGGATNWAIFGYQGKTNTLKLVESGEGGLEEVVEEFSGSHVQYGFIRVTDPNHGTSKFVLVNWTGEGAPPERKGLCANHHRDVATFFSGAHVTLNARSEADLDVDAIKKLVAKSSGANYSVHKEKPNAKYAADAPTPVTSSYTNSYKTEGAAPSTERDKFWHQQEDDAAARKKEEEAVRAREKQQAEAERIAREKEAEVKRDALMQERLAHAKHADVQSSQPSAPAPRAQPRAEPKAAPPASVPEPAHEEPAHEEPVHEEPAHEEPAATGLRAVALFDYQAAEEGELTFDPEEIITDVEMIDEGWWKGTCRGATGLFPSNFVQLLE